MRVLSIIHYPIYGGPHNRNSKVSNLLKEKGIETIVLVPDGEGNAADRLSKEGVDVVQIPLHRMRATLNIRTQLTYFKNILQDIKNIRNIIQNYKIDIVQINGFANPQGAIAAYLERIPVVWQLLDTVTPTFVRWALLPIVKKISTVIMSTGMKVALEHPGMSSRKDKIITFYPPVDLDRFRKTQEMRELARQELGVKEGEIVIGNVSNVNPKKGHIWFIRAAAQLAERMPNIKFVILGTTYETHTNYVKKLWSTAKELGLNLGNNLIVIQPGQRVPELESAFDIFWMTSEPKSEGISTAVEEAMALGLPVVCTDVGSMNEIVINGETGYIVPTRNPEAIVEATMSLINDANQMKKIGENAHNLALDNFSKENCAKTHLRAYQMALEGMSKKDEVCMHE